MRDPTRSECRSPAGSIVCAISSNKQLDPAIIAVSQVRQLPGVIGQRRRSTRTSAASELSNSGAIATSACVAAPPANAETSAPPERGSRWRLRNRLRRIGLKQNLPLDRARIFSQPPPHPGSTEIGGQSRQSDDVAQVMIAAHQKREFAMSLDETEMLPEGSSQLIKPGLLFVAERPQQVHGKTEADAAQRCFHRDRPIHALPERIAQRSSPSAKTGEPRDTF